MSLSSISQGSSSLRGESGSYQVTVNTILADDILEIFKASEAVVKIDIESLECKALQESKRFFETVKVHALFMEWIHIQKFLGRQDEDEQCLHNLVNHLRDVGLKPYAMDYQFDFNNKNKSLLSYNNMKQWPMDIVWIRN